MTDYEPIQKPAIKLGLTELHTEAPSTVVLIHGGFSNGREWRRAADLLTEYHILIPDLPAHGRSRQAFPSFSTSQAADLIADIIREKSKGGKARIVGLSLGAHVGLAILTRHPDVVDEDAILTGYNVWSEISIGIFAGVGWTGTRIINLLPESKAAKEQRKDEDGTLHPAQSYAFWKEVAGVICTENWPQPWSARTMIIAGGNRGGAPVTDRPGSARKLRDIGVKTNPETQAYWNDNLIHAWPVEKPDFFVETARAWFRRQSLPNSYIIL